VVFVKEMEEILYMMMMLQKIVYGGEDLAEKVTIEIKTNFRNKTNLVVSSNIPVPKYGSPLLSNAEI
jgi:hypothetical protein